MPGLVTAFVVVVALIGWTGLVVFAFRLRATRRAVRSGLSAPEGGANVAEASRGDESDMEQRVARAEAIQHWLLLALDESTDAIVVVDRIGREVLRNAAGRQLAMSRTGDVLAEEELAGLLDDALLGRSTERELQLYGPPRQFLQIRVFPLRHDAEIVGAVGFTRDMSESRHVENVRRDFVANVSHELKTPIGALGLLAETMAATDDVDVVRQLADRVMREADRLARIVDDLLDLSAIEAPESPVAESIQIHQAISEAVDIVHASATAAGVALRVAPEPCDAEIVGDARHMRSAILNLLDNAIKYSEPGGVVEVCARVEGQYVSVVVRDNGVGIPTRDLERIFERFYRVDRARSRETGGTGLGLSIVRHVARAHGGEVTVHSREGEGSTFTLSIPVKQTGERGPCWKPSNGAPDD